MSLLTRADVTAVRFYKDYVLAGIGSKIHVFETKSTKLLQRLDGLYGQKIYGLVGSDYNENILIFGGKQFTLISLESFTVSGEENGVFSRRFRPIICDDWIHSAVWVDDNIVALLTAHNVVQKWNTTTCSLISTHPSRDNSILYSGLLLPLQGDILVLAGTVFSEVIIHRCQGGKPLHRLKGHKGVIFSISCKPKHNIILTTSDDRSVRIWGPNDPPTLPPTVVGYWDTINLVCKHEMYGHSARVMRSCITSSLIVSVGEDSAICYWDYHGKLLKQTASHQNSPIWSVDSDDALLVTGGGDCGVTIHPLTVAIDYSRNEVVNIDVDAPKKVVFTARNNIVILDANDLTYYNFDTKNKLVHKLDHNSTYKMLSVSSCRQLIAVADMNGKFDVFVENCKELACVVKIIDTKINVGKILSMQWAGNRHIVLCSENGCISVLASCNSNTEVYTTFLLPPSKERWLTASAIDVTTKTIIVGDRCGNIHIYMKGQKDPVKSFNKVHGRYGPTSINVRNNEMITTGRDGTIKYFSINNNNVKYMYARDLEFQWVEKFLDKDENVVCGFQERVFVVYDVSSNSKILEVMCGGGHRSWDAVRYFNKEKDNYEEYIKLVYLKNSDINITTFKLSNIVSRNVINGSHSKEINCLRAYKTGIATFYISGGEDTTLRISSVGKAMKFHDEVIFKHLSSIRTLKLHNVDENNIILISAGGRAQICIKHINFGVENDKIKVKSEELIDYLIKGTDKERKGDQTWRNCSIDFDPEMRIMDIDVITEGDTIFVFAGCSDAYLRVFAFKRDIKKLDVVKEIKYHSTCILKTNIIKLLERYVLITCTTRGDVTLWDVSDVSNAKLAPFFTIKTNKSGINSIVTSILSPDRIFVATGGDDNTIHLILLQINQNDLNSTRVLSTFNLENYHSSQITGLCVIDHYLLSTSIDQRVTLFRWGVEEEAVGGQFLRQAFTDVADVQGMDVVGYDSDTIRVCVFGKGVEVVAMKPNVEAVTGPVWLGEGPHWDAAEQALYFVSIFDHTINKYTPATGTHTKAKLDGMPTFIIPIEGKRHHFAVGLNRTVAEVQWAGAEGGARVLRAVAEVDQDNPNNRFNDAKADPRGRLFAGTMGHEYEPGKFHLKKGSLYRIDADGSVHKLESNIDISNGLCWDLERKAFYYADSFEYAVRRYDYDVETGNISNPRLVFVYKDHGLEGIVDGMTIDTDGNLWIANFDGHQMIKVDPRAGKLLEKVRIPALQVTSATFGGAALDQLYVTSAAMNRGAEQRPPCGATFRLTGLGVRGHPNVNVKLN